MQSGSRYLIGIDLGTTNSVIAYIDTQKSDGDGSAPIQIFSVPQVVAPGEVRSLSALPSFLYFPEEHEVSSGLVDLPWRKHPHSIAGVMAREQGGLVPGRQVASAKSWLCQPAVDRTADILPWDAEPPEPKISPVEASSRFLAHLRDAWNNSMTLSVHTESRFENQQIVLTVPASFDEEARELTVEAARRAGLENVTLLEEPLAAFYAWIAGNHDKLSRDINDGDLVFICDIGGGTSDFSLIRARVHGADVEFERTAIGEHLLLGGDNLDLALVGRVEEKINAPKLTLRQRHALKRACCSAKEQLLSDATLERIPITVLGSGRAVVGQMIATEVTRDEVRELLIDGFLPLTSANDLPVTERRAGLRELGLPYVTDPAITKHIAAFLRQAATTMRRGAPQSSSENFELPESILFNGGFCTPEIARARIAEAIGRWADKDGWCPRVLGNAALESAVAVGAAYYGRVRQGAGLRVKAGNARSYYIGLRSEPQQLQAVCVLPAGAQEGTTLPLDREFAVLANRPVSFNLFSSRTRHDAHGDVATLNQAEVHRHAPLVTMLRYGKKLRELKLAVRLTTTFTELGTLELSCESVGTPHRWPLRFELRAAEAQALQASEQQAPVAVASVGAVSQEALGSAAELIRSTFAKTFVDEPVTPEALVGRLEDTLGLRRESWPVSVVRPLCDVLLDTAEGRRKHRSHEIRWLNLLGFCLRPGFGAPGDDARMARARKFYPGGTVFPNDVQCQSEWLVLWRRICGGTNSAQQHEMHRKYTNTLAIGRKKKGERLNRQIEHEAWRLLAALEQIPAALRATLGNELVSKIRKEPADATWLWTLGRLGARIPLYGPMSCVVPPETAGEWLRALLDLREFTTDAASALVLLAQRTDDRHRDIDDGLRREAAARAHDANISEELLARLENSVPPDRSDATRMFGESLPRGLQLISSSNCLLSVTGLISDAQKVS